jgi:flagellar motor switch protein FliN/FliY
MTDAAVAPARPEPADYVQIWVQSFSQVLEQVAGSAVPCALRQEAPPDFPAAGDDSLWILVTSSGGLRGEMTLRLAAAGTLRLAQIFMSEPVAPEAPLTPDHRDAVVELLRQVAGIVTTSAKPRWGEMQLRLEAAPAAPSWQPATTYWLLAGEEGPTGVGVEFGLSAAMVAELRAEKSEAAKSSAAAPPGPSAAAAAEATLQPSDGRLDLLMEVQLSMMLRFGARRLLLREVLELGPGAVVELDRQIQEPVDLLLDGRLVARGEVVVIAGNYGLRVTEVVAAAD